MHDGGAFDIAIADTIVNKRHRGVWMWYYGSVMDKRKHRLGVTAIELIVGVGIMSVLIMVISFFSIRVFGISRQEVEQGRINETIRVQQERMSDIIRSAVNLDVDGSGEYDGGVERWIQTAEDYSIVVWADANGDGAMELTTYLLSGSGLQLDGETVAVGVQNMVLPTPVPMFKYYSVGGANALLVDPAVVGLDAIDRVEITLVIDADTAQAPKAGVFSTVVTPRRGYLASP